MRVHHAPADDITTVSPTKMPEEPPFLATGSLHLAYREDEAAVGREFSEQVPSLGYQCAWLSAQETLQRNRAVRVESLLGALWNQRK
ncbi:MAG TPA: hypothetical protein VNB49_18500 [Candidatus Dormibacteraeota bacterium]|nr:hypothetical protein [Candidatus Dormibacteraeota bacterium]